MHLISEKIDNGPIIDFESSIFPHWCKIPLDYDNYAKNKFLSFYEKFIKNLCNKKKFNLKFQPDYLGVYYPRLNTDLNGWINWNLKSYQNPLERPPETFRTAILSADDYLIKDFPAMP